MAKRATYENLLAVTLTRYKIETDRGEIDACTIRLVIDSLSVEAHVFMEAIEGAFPEADVNFPRLGRATLDLCAPRGIDDQDLVNIMTKKIGAIVETFPLIV